jgi:hypothetical protein
VYIHHGSISRLSGLVQSREQKENKGQKEKIILEKKRKREGVERVREWKSESERE